MLVYGFLVIFNEKFKISDTFIDLLMSDQGNWWKKSSIIPILSSFWKSHLSFSSICKSEIFSSRALWEINFIAASEN